LRRLDGADQLGAYKLTRDNTCEESCGRGRGGVQPWACWKAL